MSVTFYASERHYADHLWPVFTRWTDTARHADWYYDGDPQLLPECLGGNTVVVSATIDMRTAFRAKASRIVLMQHGAGQSYSNRHSSYPGGSGHTRAALALMPNEQAAERHRKYHPRVPAEVIGCPKLDEWVTQPPKRRPDLLPPGVVISFHWDCKVAREAGTVWGDYGPEAIEALWEMDQRGEIALRVHAHPKIADEVRESLYGKIPVGRFTSSFIDVMRWADLYICDNSSSMFEFAALDRPVVVMNSPRWRRNVHHGGRFWDWAGVGIQVDRAEDLPMAVGWALTYDEPVIESRRRVVREVYPFLGESRDRAVAAIAALEGS